jgi:Recombination endonuclease VII
MTKTCAQCKQEQPLSEFYTNRRDKRLGSYCKTCTKRNSRQRYVGLSDAEKLLVAKKAKASKYGMTLTEFDAYVDAHDDFCDICGREEDTKRKAVWTRGLTLDHCHATGKVRGMLCSRCNCAMGHVREDISVLEKMIQYLQRE